MIWGSIHYYGKLPLVLILVSKNNSLTAVRYLIEVVKPVLAPAVASLRRYSPLVVEDGSKLHHAAEIGSAKRRLHIENTPHPAASPDLNAIENLWGIIRVCLRQRGEVASSQQQLWEWIKEEWEAIPMDMVRRIIGSMEERRQAVVRLKGFSTSF